MPYYTPAKRPAAKTKVFFVRMPYNIKLKNAIAVAFDGDEDLRKYHIKPTLLDNKQMAFHTYREIGKQRDPGKASLYYYGVYVSGEHGTALVGFTVICRLPLAMLYSFGINHQYRNKEVLTKWLECVQDKFEGIPFGTVLNIKNTRAIRFFEKNGFQQTHSNKRLNIVSLCPASQLTT